MNAAPTMARKATSLQIADSAKVKAMRRCKQKMKIVSILMVGMTNLEMPR
jgi:hypothetical protein